MDFKSKRNRFLGRSLRSPQVPRGLYFWAEWARQELPDGCLLRLRALPPQAPHSLSPLHGGNHRELRKFAGGKDPLLAYADQIAKATRLLCFDEFHVSDIADAMILGRLLSRCWSAAWWW
ncbi:AFG1-like ATPase [Chromobacterium violaceum]|uniref:AFG1-like ATPase n=1 Tax=Chromobacterium violaceum TaxID=536 RepID=A0A3S4HP08_CHRVL|nr:AFG1-like ATPase [Chromobacterium violaceum]